MEPLLDPITPYCGPPPLPSDLWQQWNLDPFVIAVTLAPMLAVLLLPGRDRRAGIAASLALGVAFISPLCALTVALFSARELHHLVIVLAAGPALALAWPMAGKVARAGAFIGLSAFIWLWHVPAIYTLAWDSVTFYWLMQAGLIVSAWAFWSCVLRVDRAGGSVGPVAQVLALAGQMGLLGAILTFAPRVLYTQHAGLTRAFGFDALTDQQLGGLVMWVPGMLPLALLGALLLRRSWRQVVASS